MHFVPGKSRLVSFGQDDTPRLLVLVDAEEEFNWSSYSPNAKGVRNIALQFKAQNIFNAHCVTPTYLVDFPVASQAEGYEPLRELVKAGACKIGAQLHPWVNPPLEEEITVRNTYAGNLPEALERAKIEKLTSVIEENFGQRPNVFRAGRWGAGPNTAAIITSLGYTIDSSILPLANFSIEGGPNYMSARAFPYWVDAGALLELPVTVGVLGLLKGLGARGRSILLGRSSTRLLLPGVLSHLGLLERIRLTPEGTPIEDAKRLTRGLLQQGQRLFVVSYHSSSLLPGGNPYASNAADVERLLDWLGSYLTFFFQTLGGKATTAEEVYASARAGQV
jgi:hypothetical protein